MHRQNCQFRLYRKQNRSNKSFKNRVIFCQGSKTDLNKSCMLRQPDSMLKNFVPAPILCINFAIQNSKSTSTQKLCPTLKKKRLSVPFLMARHHYSKQHKSQQEVNPNIFRITDVLRKNTKSDLQQMLEGSLQNSKTVEQSMMINKITPSIKIERQMHPLNKTQHTLRRKFRIKLKSELPFQKDQSVPNPFTRQTSKGFANWNSMAKGHSKQDERFCAWSNLQSVRQPNIIQEQSSQQPSQQFNVQH